MAPSQYSRLLRLLNQFNHLRPTSLVSSSVVFICFAIQQAPSIAQFHDVTITQIDGSTFNGTIESIATDGTLSGAGLPDKLQLSEILLIDVAQPTLQSDAYNATLHTIGGGKLLIGSPTISPDAVRFESNSGIEEIPLQTLRAIVWKSSRSIEKTIDQPSPADDSVFVETPDGLRTVTGIVESLDNKKLAINYQNESRKIGVEKLAAIVMADLGLKPPTDSIASIEFYDGSSINGAIESLRDGVLTLKLAGDKPLTLSAEKILNLTIRSDRLQYLSDLTPTDVQQRTEFTLQRSWQRDRSIGNHRLAIRIGKTDQRIEFNKGLGTQSFTQLDFANAGYHRFQATVGIDAETNGHGDCQLVVRGDGIELWSGRVQGIGEPQEIDVDISGMETISLVVYPGEDFDLADHANWGNARFVK